MMLLTKIFRFEAAHAIHGYPGPCANIHGHSYELHVCVAGSEDGQDFITGTGIILDFKDLKVLVQESVVQRLDHRLILSKNFLAETDMVPTENIFVFQYEPTAENLLIFIQKELNKHLPSNIRLVSLKLWETHNSYAEWSAS